MVRTEAKRPSRGAFIGNIIATLVVFPTVTLALAGNWGWVEGWIFAPSTG